MAEGKSITLLPSGAQVNMQQTADLLNISCWHLIKVWCLVSVAAASFSNKTTPQAIE
jgi:hypothetical protein